MDPGFNPDIQGGVVYAVAVQPDGKIVLAGSFTSVGGTTRNRVARLDASGGLDTGFNPNVNGTVNAIALQADGKIILGGAFTSIGFSTFNRIGRLNADGSRDTAFNPNINGNVLALAVQADGRILVGGDYSSVGGTPRSHLSRLLGDGTLDTDFAPGANDRVRGFALQPDGRMLVAGNFDVMAGVARVSLARLNASGSADPDYHPDVLAGFGAMALQADGKLLITGNIYDVGGVLTSDFVRLNADGTRDPAFAPSSALIDPIFGNGVSALPDGKSVFTGQFRALGGAGGYGIGRLGVPEAAMQNLEIIAYAAGANRIAWRRRGPAPELLLPPEVYFSLAGTNYSLLGTMQRTGNGWVNHGFVPPMNQTFYLRTRGLIGGSGSTGVEERTWQFFLDREEGIFAGDVD